MDLATARARAADRWRLNAFVTMTTTEAGSGPVVAVKDNLDVWGCPTTAGSPGRRTGPAERDADVVAAVRAHGAVVVGKASCGEWALDVTGTAQEFGTVRNPHDEARTAGGSSSGAGVAVAAGLCDWAVGTDTGGSVRVPAALCGVVGFKPTYGTLSMRGLVPSCPSLDTVGVLAPTVAVAARAVEQMGGPPAPGEPLDHEPRLAVPRSWVEGLDADAAAVWRRVATGLDEVDVPDLDEFRAAFLALGPPEAAWFHTATLADPSSGISPYVRAVLERGRSIAAVDYLEARVRAGALRDALERALVGRDALLLPAVGRVAPTLDEAPALREEMTRLVRPASLTGHPVVCLPAPSAGLPVGIQVVGHHGGDPELLGVAAVLEARWAARPAGRAPSAPSTSEGAPR